MWRVAAGARWFEFTERLDDYFAGLLAGGQNEAHASYRESGMTPRLGIEFRPSDLAFVYFNAAQGFRPGGVNEFTAEVLEACQQDLDALGIDSSPSFKSDSLWNLEVGARTRWLDDRLEMSVALFHIDWEDMQTLQFLPSCGNGIMGNAGGATSNGTELELTWLAHDSLIVGLTAAYVDARIEEDVPSLGAEAGQRIPTVPQWSASARLRQEFGLAAEIAGFWQAEIQYGDATWNSWDRSTRVEVDSREVVHLRAGASLGRWGLELFAENVFDQRGVLFDNRDFLGEWQSLVRPRTVGMRARVDF
jgi:outer membrane receptor protein involved in Fe transport